MENFCKMHCNVFFSGWADVGRRANRKSRVDENEDIEKTGNGENEEEKGKDEEKGGSGEHEDGEHGSEYDDKELDEDPISSNYEPSSGDDEDHDNPEEYSYPT